MVNHQIREQVRRRPYVDKRICPGCGRTLGWIEGVCRDCGTRYPAEFTFFGAVMLVLFMVQSLVFCISH